ncbi:hypothetical protein FEF65_06745 [Mariprofundus erugo]|uniref:EI24 domain-containing protein n=1 Tax=Mariprofundus erugo TaxID=2528639 RepID=A0A5R9GRB5_9PROT|nr:EI24 domain-containing protein [Mariprofundus erugo]TLS67605.1 hypothetical protein FEF65_06745 [Mariprofundus erugo]
MIKGVFSLLAGIRLLFVEPDLRSVLWRMLALLIALMVAATMAAFQGLDYLATIWLPQGDAWYWQLLSAVVWVLALLLSLVTGALAYVALGSAAVAPWLDTLAVRTERLHGVGESAANSDSWMMQVTASLANSIRPLGGLLAWGAVALLFIWLPPLATAIWTYAGIRFLGYELMDTTASRQAWAFHRRKQELNEQRWFYIGFAGVAMLLLMVPVLNLLVIPAAVVALSSRPYTADQALKG